MSQSGDEGMKGSGGDDNAGRDKKGKGITAEPDDQSQPLTSDEDSTDLEEEVKARRSTLDCLASLEDSLPMKRGLSGYYTGKSKSFGNLTDLTLDDPNDLGKKEHPVNKKRRLLIAHEIFHENKQGGSSANHMNEEEEDDVDKEEKNDDKNSFLQ